MNLRLFAFLVAFGPALLAAPVSGEAVYQKRCAACHDSPGSRAPSRDSLKTRSVLSIQRTLDFGIMSNVASPMRRDERDAVASWLGVAGGSAAPPAKAFCADRSVKITGKPSGWNGWSASPGNTRFQSADAAGLTMDGVRRLKLKWAYGFDGDAVTFAQPTVLDRQIFVGSASGLVQALAMETGCVKWVFQAAGPVRSAILAVPSGSAHVLLFGDQVGWFYALDAETGRQLWKKRPEPHESTRLTGAPVAYQGTVYVPVSSWEENRTINPDYPCCAFRGSIVAYRISDGSQLWKTYTIPEKPKVTGKNKAGVEQWGPSGGSVWGSPTLDAKRGLLYATTGDNFSLPSTPMSDSVLALELATGRIVWAKQTTPGDVWTSGCGQRGDCPGPDHDYGSSVLLEKRDDGRDILLAGQKSGVVYGQAPELRMPGETLGDELHVLAGVILDQYRRRVPFLGKLLSESMQDPKVGALFYGTFIVQGRLLFTEFLGIRKEFGELRDDIDVEAAAAMFLAALTGILLMHELFGGKQVETLDDDRVLRQMCDTFLHGIVRR